jgi:CPA2 family monovalent cation:H+ antiporter-2
VLGNVGRTSGVVTEDVYALVVSSAIVSFFLSAFLVPLAPRFGNQVARFLRQQQQPDDAESASREPPEIVIIGFGPAGQIAARPLVDGDVSVTVIDLNSAGVQKAKQLGFRGEVGDATQSEVLEHARIHESRSVVITIPHHKSAAIILDLVRSKAPHVHVIVRSRYEIHTEEFIASGAHAVAGDEEQVGERLAQQLLDWQAKKEPGRIDPTS